MNEDYKKQIRKICGFSESINRYNHLDEVLDIKNGDVVIDCGAHQGDTSMYFSHKVGENGKVYAIEIERGNCERLNKNLNEMNLKNVTIVNVGIADKRCTYPLYDSPWSSTYNIFKNSTKTRNKLKPIPCECDTLDNIVNVLGINRIDFIYMNMEGAEYLAIDGMKEVLTKFKPKLYISDHAKYLPKSFVKKHNIREKLKNYGYNIIQDNPILAEWR